MQIFPVDLGLKLNLMVAATFGCLSLGSPHTAQAASPKQMHPLASHRAVYDMKLADSGEQSGVAGLSGRMVYDFSGNACDGYSVNFRFVTRFQDVNGGSQITDLQTTSFEEPEAESYQFLSKTFVDKKLVESSRGTARVNKAVRSIELTEPSEKKLDIARNVQFPTEHLLTVLNAARNGTRFVAMDIFDGAETGDKVYGTTTVIGKASTSKAVSDEEPGKALEGETYWPVTIAYFDTSTDDASGELMPIYQLTFQLFQNGISNNLVLDYGDFKLNGTMTDLELYGGDDCVSQ